MAALAYRDTHVGAALAYADTVYSGAAPSPPTIEIFVRSPQLALLPNLTNLKWCMFLQATPDLFDSAPVARGATLATDGGAKLVIPATLAPRVYFLIFTTSDGTTTQMPPPQSFAAPITVA